MKRADDSPATWGDIKRIYKLLNERISDSFEEISKVDDKQAGFWDEHEEKINRHQRAIRRLENRVTELEEADAE